MCLFLSKRERDEENGKKERDAAERKTEEEQLSSGLSARSGGVEFTVRNAMVCTRAMNDEGSGWVVLCMDSGARVQKV